MASTHHCQKRLTIFVWKFCILCVPEWSCQSYCSKSNKNLTKPVCWTKCSSSLLDFCSKYQQNLLIITNPKQNKTKQKTKQKKKSLRAAALRHDFFFCLAFISRPTIRMSIYRPSIISLASCFQLAFQPWK